MALHGIVKLSIEATTKTSGVKAMAANTSLGQRRLNLKQNAALTLAISKMLLSN
ncbi:hypothetical protein M404DRAFT_995451 [Pisolithus tinctorius Marx 270]|uniref:Uncharacterized protein n=1 Tax=Pisolithus tinctorius Marx 270 TaxID=870435 RepID=A0A0C3JM62_PISTI|nr:hypothetical protein M404DRAFT_995451 [Pisolithus tinctorius Marx 270]